MSRKLQLIAGVFLILLLCVTPKSYAAPSSLCSIEIRGSGYLELLLPTGHTAYTRKGLIRKDKLGSLYLNGFMLSPSLNIPADTTNFQISKVGEASVRLSDSGEKLVIGVLTIARFADQKKLVHIGRSIFRESGSSGPPIYGTPGRDGYGRIVCVR